MFVGFEVEVVHGREHEAEAEGCYFRLGGSQNSLLWDAYVKLVSEEDGRGETFYEPFEELM